MTQAACIKCGHQKLGALTPCPQCRFSPDEAEDQAKSILLSDHHLGPAQLEELSKKFQRGEPVSFDEASFREAQLCEEASDLGVTIVLEHIPHGGGNQLENIVVRLDYGFCGIDCSKELVSDSRAKCKIPMKCATCVFLKEYAVLGLACSKDPEVWGDKPRGLDY